MKRKNLKMIGLILSGVIVIVSLTYAIDIQPLVIGRPSWFTSTSELMTFGSYSELAEFLGYKYHNYSDNYCWYGQSEGRAFLSSMSKSIPNSVTIDSDGVSEVDYSDTNIQVEGVDEPDVVKTDGTYLYMLANSKIYIVKAYPAEDAVVLSIISIDIGDVTSFFINENRLVVFARSQRYPIEFENDDTDDYDTYYGYWGGVSTTIIKIYDIADRENPELDNDIEVDGYYFDARMIGDYIYIITTEYSSDVYRALEEKVSLNVPEIKIDNRVKKIPACDIFYVNSTEQANTFTNVISINIFSGDVNQKSFLLGSSQNMYVSRDNIFLTYTEYEYIESDGILGMPYWSYVTKTNINKISIKNGEIEHTAQGVVPGTVLNQFSMDEHNGYFRIATTLGEIWDTEHPSSNNIYILDENLERVSEIEGIASGEKIYSARFMGNRAYLVTFKKVDPFFTIDLSDPNNPKILGELKIPGYSDYLHPFDENHVIGIGKDTVEPQEEYSWTRDFAWYQGLKIALFDVSDFDNPKVESQVIIGDRGTDSPVLYDHKAFLFDREKGLLVIPVELHEIADEIKEQNGGYTGSTYGKFTFQGAYVYKLTLDDGFEYRGRITHMDEDEIPDDGYYWYWGYSSSYISRSLYIEDALYTISDKMVKMNSLDDLSEINSINLD